MSSNSYTFNIKRQDFTWLHEDHEQWPPYTHVWDAPTRCIIKVKAVSEGLVSRSTRPGRPDTLIYMYHPESEYDKEMYPNVHPKPDFHHMTKHDAWQSVDKVRAVRRIYHQATEALEDLTAQIQAASRFLVWDTDDDMYR